jgi:DNA polymerase III delta subunit
VDFDGFLRRVAAGPPPAVALLHGADTQLLDDALAAVSQALGRDPAATAFDREVLDGREASAAAVVQSAMTLPVAAPLRLVAVRHCQALPVKAREVLADYAARPNPSACLLLLSDESLAAGRGRKEHWLLGAVPAAAVVTLPARTGPALEQWLRRRAAAEGLTVSEEAAHQLVEWVGDDGAALLGEVRKAALAGGPHNQSVGAREVASVVGERRVSGVFDLTAAVTKGDMPLAVRALESLLATEEPVRIVALLGAEVRMGWTIEVWSGKGQRLEQIARILNRPLHVVQAHAARAREAPGAAPSRLRLCWEADRRLKSGGDARAELTALVVALCGR